MEVWRNPDNPDSMFLIAANPNGVQWSLFVNNTVVALGDNTDKLFSALESTDQPSTSDWADWAKGVAPKEEIKWEGEVPKFDSEEDKKFMKDFEIRGSRIAKVTKGKTGGRSPNFSFAVPLKAAGAVAFHLAKAGMKDFEVVHSEDGDSSVFAFTNEPEMHLGEEIVRAQFADQIMGHKGMWGAWSPSAKMEEDPSLVKSEQELHAPTAGKTADDVESEREMRDRMVEEDEGRQDKELHEDPNSYLRGKQFSGPQAVPSRYEEALEQALSALEVLAEIGPSDDVKGCASMSAGDLRQFAEDAQAGRARHFSSDESPCCCVVGHMKFKGSMQKQAFDANLTTLIGSFVSAVLVKWLGHEYSKRWGTLAEQAETKAIQALQNRGVYDLSTLDKYAAENGVSQIGAFMRLAGKSMLLAAAMTTGIVGEKILSGDAKMQSKTPTQNQMTITDEVDVPTKQPQRTNVVPQQQQDEEVSPQRQQNLV